MPRLRCVAAGDRVCCNRSWKRKTWLSVAAGLTLLLLSMLVLWVATRRPSRFSTIGFHVRSLPRPKWFMDALAARHIIGLDGGVPQRAIVAGFSNETFSLWLFGDTIMNCTYSDPPCGWGWQMVNNAALLLRINAASSSSVVDAAFPVTADGLYTPQIILPDFKEEGAIWGGGFTIDDEIFVIWSGSSDWKGTGQGSGSFTVKEGSFLTREAAPATEEAAAAASSSSPLPPPTINVTRARPDDRRTTADWPNGPAIRLDPTSEFVYFLQVRNLSETSSSSSSSFLSSTKRDVVLGRTHLSNIREGYTHSLDFLTTAGVQSNELGLSTFEAGVAGLRKAKSLFPLPGPGLDLIWREDLGFTALIPDWLGGQVVARTADQLEGEWSDETVLLKVDGNPYSTLWHPELSFSPSTLVATYCGPEYLPYFFEIELGRKRKA